MEKIMSDEQKFAIICDNIKKNRTSVIVDYEDGIPDSMTYYYNPGMLSDDCIFVMDDGDLDYTICMVSDIRPGEDYPTYGMWYPETFPINNTTIDDVITFIAKNNWPKLLEGLEYDRN